MTDATTNSTPQAPEAEASVLGSVLINPETYIELAEFLKASDFYVSRNRTIWESIVRLVEAKTSIDVITLGDDLEGRNQLELVGGSEYLIKLVNDVPTASHAVSYGRMVLRASTARNTIEAAAKMIALAHNPDLSAEDMVSQAQTITIELAASVAIGSESNHVGELVDGYLDSLKERQEHPEDFNGVLSGLVDLDALIGGFRAPGLITIAGRPGSGKTSLMTTAALNAASRHQKRVMIFSLEMSNEQLMERFMAMLTGINVEIFNRSSTVESDWPRIEEARDKLKTYQIYIDDSGLINTATIRAKVAKHIMTVGPLDLVIVDYLQLMQGDPGKKYNNRVDEVSFISRSLKLIARQFNVAVLAGSQLSRAIEQRQDHRPVLSDLRESGSIEQDSDVVIFTSSTSTENLMDIITAKNRQGRTGDVQAFFRKETTSFHSAETRNIEL